MATEDCRQALERAATIAAARSFIYHFFRPGRWVRADAAAVFAALLELGLRSTFDAADAAFALVTSLLDLREIEITSLQPFE